MVRRRSQKIADAVARVGKVGLLQTATGFQATNEETSDFF
jgi:hypothetical protein